MTDQAHIQSKINHGYAIAAAKLGAPFALYRPQSTGPVIAPINLMDVINFAYDIDYKFSFQKPDIYEHPEYYGLLDLTEMVIGDYLTDEGKNTFYFANIEPLKPPLMVRCFHTVTIYRPSNNSAGTTYYGGNVTGFGAPVMTSWPASILLGPKGERNQSGLPADPRAPWYVAYLPQHLLVDVKTGDIMIDQTARRYTISAVETTILGFKMTLAYSGT